MEPIVLCGVAIVIFGLWVEFSPTVQAVVKIVMKNRFWGGGVSHSAAQKPEHVYAGKMPICVAKTFCCRNSA